MAHFEHSQSPAAEIGGKHTQNHKIASDTTAGMRNGDQHTLPAVVTPQKNSNPSGGRGSESASEDNSNADEEGDGNGDKEDNDEDETDVVAPFRGHGLGKGKRPSIRIEPAEDDESEGDTARAPSRGAGQKSSKAPVGHLLMREKKRTFSNVSNSSLLFGEEEDNHTFPRRKLARTLSNTSSRGLLIYQKDVITNNGPDNAIEDSDEEAEKKSLDVDDEDYSGVNLISDDSDVEEVEKQEEEWIINDAQQHSTDLFNDARRLSLDSYTESSYFARGVPLSDNFLDTNEFPDVGFGQFFEPDPLPTSPEPRMPRKFSDSSTKRVRFDDEVDVSDTSSGSESELDSTLWPDLFEKDKLPQTVYRMIEDDNNNIDNLDYPSSGSENSFWEFEDHSRFLGDEDDDSEPGSSGYETDLGDTTDEYDSDFNASPPPQTPRQSVLRRPASAPGSRLSSPKGYQRSNKPNTTGKQFIPPVCGVFIHEERDEAIAVTNRTTKTVQFYRPRTTITVRRGNYGTGSSSTSTAQNSPLTTLHQLSAEDTDPNDAFANHLNATDIMFAGIFGGASNNDFFNMLGGSTVGPPEAFYPFVSVNPNGAMRVMSDDDDYDDEEAEFGADVDIEEFMNFGVEGDETDVEMEDSTDLPATPATSMAAFPGSTPGQPTPNHTTPTRNRTMSDAMIQHFDRGVVTAFRNNQNHYRNMARLPHDPDMRASVSRPLRSGGSAETLMSPIRKRSVSKKMKGSGFVGIGRSGGRRLASTGADSHRGPRMGTFS